MKHYVVNKPTKNPPPILSDQSGTLLLETFLAAMIFLTLFPLIIYKSTLLYQHVELEQFMNALNAFIYDAQSKAVTERRSTQVDLNETSHHVYAYYSMFDQLNTLPVPVDIHFQPGSHSLLIQFTPNGTIKQGGTLFVKTQKEMFQITFLLGQGRFYASKL